MITDWKKKFRLWLHAHWTRNDGQVLYLWIRRKGGEIEYDFDLDSGDDEEDDPGHDN